MSQLDDLLARLEQAILDLDIAAIQEILAEIQLLDQEGGGGEGDTPHLVKEGYRLLDTPLSPMQPHGDQAVQRSPWNFIGAMCGRCRNCPRYWSVKFDWTPSGQTPEQIFGTLPTSNDPGEWNISGGPFAQFLAWFMEAQAPESGFIQLLRRGKMAPKPPDGDSHSQTEAEQKRYICEYDRCFWKKKVTLFIGDPRQQISFLNVAWFLYYADIVKPDDAFDLQTDSDVVQNPPTDDQESIPHRGWVLALVENTRRKPTGSGTEWINTYGPLLDYQLLPKKSDGTWYDPYAEGFDKGSDTLPKAIFDCFGVNKFFVVNNSLNIPRHIATVETFWP